MKKLRRDFTRLSSGAELPLRVDPLSHLRPALGQPDEGQAGKVGLLSKHSLLLKTPGIASILQYGCCSESSTILNCMAQSSRSFARQRGQRLYYADNYLFLGLPESTWAWAGNMELYASKVKVLLCDQRTSQPRSSLNVLSPTGDVMNAVALLQVGRFGRAPREAGGEHLVVTVLDEGLDGAREADEEEVIAAVSDSGGVPVGVHDQVLWGMNEPASITRSIFLKTFCSL